MEKQTRSPNPSLWFGKKKVTSTAEVAANDWN